VTGPQTHKCERCRKRLATVILGDVVDGVKTTYRICSDCWVALGDACPRAHKTDEDAVTHWILDHLRTERERGEHEVEP
jgi:protein-arginine kinase activator protein McsA